MDVSEALNLLDCLIFENTAQHLSNLQQAIIRGVLNDMTYKQIKENETAARGYSVGYLGKYVAYELWKLLTKVMKDETFLEEGEKVSSANLWEYVERIRQKRHLTNSVKILSPPPPPIDRIFRSRYLVTEHLVSSQFSHTYLAEDLDFPERNWCVVKQLKSQSPEMTKRFEREARVLHQLGKHNQIPQLLAYFAEEENFYLVNQFIEGQVLSQKLKEDQPWSEKQVIIFLKDILSVLKFVHQHDFIHRDINPDNLIQRTLDNKIVLIDFGSVKQISLEGTISIAGTKGYIAPEQAFGRPKLCSDIYAVGIIAIQSLTGLHPTQLKVHSDTLDIIWRDKAQVSQQFADILDKMVRYDFRQRYLSAAEALQACMI